MSQFIFLQCERAAVFKPHRRRKRLACRSTNACFYERRTLELAVNWAYNRDAALNLPYQDNLRIDS
jgi:type I restriction enzyme R subunit